MSSSGVGPITVTGGNGITVDSSNPSAPVINMVGHPAFVLGPTDPIPPEATNPSAIVRTA